MARIAGVDLPREKRVEIGLTYIYGIGRTSAKKILEETGVICKTKELYCMQFKADQWCAVFTMEYISGTPKSDGYENSEVLLLTVNEALEREDLTKGRITWRGK